MKRLTAVLVIAVCLPAMLLSGMAEINNDPIALQQEADEQLQKELGAFEITAHQREIAKTNEAGYPVLDAGRGNPNWINTQADVLSLSENRYGTDFAEWLQDSRTEIDFLNDLAARKGVVLMYGPGFSAPDGTVRISLANLNEEDYVEIARRLFELLDDYYAEYEMNAMDEAA